MKFRSIVTAFAVAVSLCVSESRADGTAGGSEPGWYAALFGGTFFLDRDLLYDDYESETYLLGGAVGYENLVRLQPVTIRPEIEFSYHNESTSYPSTNRIESSFLNALANVWADFDLGRVRPYAGGGAGYGRYKFESEMPLGLFTPQEASENAFVWQVGGGINVDLSKRFFAGVGYRYFGADWESETEVPDLVNGGTRTVSSDLGARFHEVLGTIGMRF